MLIGKTDRFRKTGKNNRMSDSSLQLMDSGIIRSYGKPPSELSSHRLFDSETSFPFGKKLEKFMNIPKWTRNADWATNSPVNSLYLSPNLGSNLGPNRKSKSKCFSVTPSLNMSDYKIRQMK